MTSVPAPPAAAPRDAEPFRAPIRLSFVRWTCVATTALALVAIAVHAGASRLGDSLKLAGASVDPTPIAFDIGGVPFAIPANAVRFPEQRADPAPPELDLYLAWPSLQGFTTASAETFHDPEARSLLFVGLSSLHRKDRDRAEPNLPPPSGQGPAGLTEVRRPGLPGIASGEIVYRGQTAPGTPYEVSCLDGPDPIMAADCIREIAIGDGLRLRYRFSHRRLPEWRDIDRAVLRYVSQHRKS